jgi:hypothetical protein
VPFSNLPFIIFNYKRASRSSNRGKFAFHNFSIINGQIVGAATGSIMVFFFISQVRLYDITSQKRAIISIDFRESPIKAVREDTDGHTVYLGTAIGDLASFDMRTGTHESFPIPGC